jgi:hypothetical protein
VRNVETELERFAMDPADAHREATAKVTETLFGIPFHREERDGLRIDLKSKKRFAELA